MGAGLSQDHEASQLQPNKEASQSVPQNKAEAVEISIQAKPRPRETIARTTEEAKQSGVVHVHVHENNRSKAILKQDSTNSLKYWVDKKSKSNCFFLYAKKLSITWADSAEDNVYWRWSKIEETSNTVVDVAELLDVCWLEVHGKFETAKLSTGTTYEVAFVIMLKDPAYGWEVPVNLRLILPDGNKQERKENLMKKPRGEWIEIPVGEFVASPEKAGEIEFSIYEYEGGKWKRGLVIKGIVIRPK